MAGMNTMNGQPGVFWAPQSIPTDPKNYASWMASQFGPDWGQKWADSGGNLGTYKPGGAVPNGMGGGASQPWKDPSSYDPRTGIHSSPAYQWLTEFMKKGSGIPAQARSDVAPAMDFMNRMLSSNDPLGTAGTKKLIEQRGMSSLRDAGAAARGRLDNTFGGVNSAASPEGLALARELTRQNEAAGIGDVQKAAGEAGIQERAATGAFQSGVAQALGQLGLGLGGLGEQDLSQQSGAAIAAGQLDSFANNTWAQIMASLLQSTMSRGFSPAVPIAPGQPKPYPYPGAPGTFTGSQQADPFELLNAMWQADQGFGFQKYNPWGARGGSQPSQPQGGRYTGPGNETVPPLLTGA